jgi:two-component SAPR family response regulator
MNKRTTKLTYDEIDKLLESNDKDWFKDKDIKWKFVTEEEMESLLNPQTSKVSEIISSQLIRCDML